MPESGMRFYALLRELWKQTDTFWFRDSLTVGVGDRRIADPTLPLSTFSFLVHDVFLWMVAVTRFKFSQKILFWEIVNGLESDPLIRNSRLLVYECENIWVLEMSTRKPVYEYSKFSTSSLRVREYKVYMQVLRQNILSTLLVYECENMKFTCCTCPCTCTCNFSIKPLSTLIVYECNNQNILSTFLVYEYKKIAL